MKGIAALLAAAGFATADNASAGVPNPVNSENIRRSEQFVVHDTRRFGRSLAAFSDRDNPELVQLEPGTLLLSAERIRDALVRQLRVPPRGSGKIYCYLYAPLRNDDNIVLLSTLYTDGWQYRLEIPDDLERTKLVRGIVQTLLLEFANRGTAHKSAELPTWLIEGLTKQVLADIGPELVLDSVPTNAVRRSVREIRGADTLVEARAYFRTRSPLNFTQLSDPKMGELYGEHFHLYQLSAQMLVAELLESKGGRTRLIRMLRGLPECWNWQTAFLQAFQFERLLDAEKWWAVSATAFLNRQDLLQSSADGSLSRLDEILTVPTQIRLDTNAVPIRTEAAMIQVISEWEYSRQRPVLERKLQQLALLRLTAPNRLVPLVESYWACIHSYLLKRDQSGRTPENKRQTAVPGALLANEAVRQLAALDRQRLTLHRQSASQASSMGALRP